MYRVHGDICVKENKMLFMKMAIHSFCFVLFCQIEKPESVVPEREKLNKWRQSKTDKSIQSERRTMLFKAEDGVQQPGVM